MERKRSALVHSALLSALVLLVVAAAGCATSDGMYDSGDGMMKKEQSMESDTMMDGSDSMMADTTRMMDEDDGKME